MNVHVSWDNGGIVYGEEEIFCFDFVVHIYTQKLG